MKHFFPQTYKHEQFYFFPDDEHHLKNVLKTKLNTEIICVYEDKKYLCQINGLQPLTAKIVNQIANDCEFHNVEITLFQAVIKPKHFEWILTKSVELHLNNFYPTIFSRSQTQLVLKKDRMEKIITSACKQSGRLKICQYHDSINFQQLLDKIKLFDLVLVPYEDRQGEILGLELANINYNKIKKIALIVGPEGGFSHQEITALQQLDNTKIVSLSKTILRSETAAFYTLAVLIDNLLTKKVQ